MLIYRLYYRVRTRRKGWIGDRFSCRIGAYSGDEARTKLRAGLLRTFYGKSDPILAVRIERRTAVVGEVEEEILDAPVRGERIKKAASKRESRP